MLLLNKYYDQLPSDLTHRLITCESFLRVKGTIYDQSLQRMRVGCYSLLIYPLITA